MSIIITILMFLGLINIIISFFIDLKNTENKVFSYKPILLFFLGTGLFSLGVFLRSVIF